MSFTNEGEGMVLNRIFTTTTMKSDGTAGSTGFTVGTDDFFISLHTSDPGEAGTAAEITGTGYVRKAIAFTAVTSVGNTISNSAQIQWASIGGTWSSGANITNFGIHLTTSGTMIAKGAFGTPKPATSGDTVTIAIGDIDITMD